MQLICTRVYIATPENAKLDRGFKIARYVYTVDLHTKVL